jgi:hypothetical protein
MKSCEQYREEISALLDGELPEAESVQLRAHIAACPECRQVYDAFAALHGGLSTLEPAPDTLAKSVMRQIRKPKTLRWQRYLAAAACLVLVCAGAAKLLGGPFFGGGSSASTMGAIHERADSAVSQAAPAAAESAEEKLYATEAPAAAAPADPLPAPTAEAGSGETRMSVCAAANGAATLGADSALADLAVDTEAGIPEVPGRAPDRTAELPEGCLEIWDEGETMVCRLGDWVFVPADPADILALLEG